MSRANLDTISIATERWSPHFLRIPPHTMMLRLITTRIVIRFNLTTMPGLRIAPRRIRKAACIDIKISAVQRSQSHTKFISRESIHVIHSWSSWLVQKNKVSSDTLRRNSPGIAVVQSSMDCLGFDVILKPEKKFAHDTPPSFLSRQIYIDCRSIQHNRHHNYCLFACIAKILMDK